MPLAPVDLVCRQRHVADAGCPGLRQKRVVVVVIVVVVVDLVVVVVDLVVVVVVAVVAVVVAAAVVVEVVVVVVGVGVGVVVVAVVVVVVIVCLWVGECCNRDCDIRGKALVFVTITIRSHRQVMRPEVCASG